MILFKKCYTLREALLIQMQLRGSGIETTIPNEHSAEILGAAAGIRVLIDPEDFDRANEILLNQEPAEE